MQKICYSGKSPDIKVLGGTKNKVIKGTMQRA